MAIKYPYIDVNEMNLDWVLRKLKELETRVAALEENEEVEENGNQ